MKKAIYVSLFISLCACNTPLKEESPVSDIPEEKKEKSSACLDHKKSDAGMAGAFGEKVDAAGAWPRRIRGDRARN